MINASLGAHYSPKFIWLSIQQLWRTLLHLQIKDESQMLEKKLNTLFAGKKTQLVYKGRDAIELALKGYGFTHSSDCIATQAFSCSALEEAITRAGATPLYVDIGKNTLNLTAENLEEAWQKNKNIRAVIVQHSLGHLANIEKIRTWCDKKKILLIEDLAQSFGATDAEGNIVGTHADCVVLSFGRDKVVDAVSGGAVIFKKQMQMSEFHLNLPPHADIVHDLRYPVMTWCIRSLFSIGLGKVLHAFWKKMGWLTTPTLSPTDEATLLPPTLVPLILFQLEHYQHTYQHRKEIASYYFQAFENHNVTLLTQPSNLESGSLLRFVLSVPDPSALIKIWKKENIHLSDRWYRHAVDGGTSFHSHWYEKGSCPNAELLAEQVVNLPTHTQISLKDAEKIVQGITRL